MAFDIAKEHLEKLGLGDRIHTFEVSSATVELAAQAVGCEPARIAKTLSFMVQGSPILVVAAGDAKVDNHKYKDQFGVKAKMLSPDEVAGLVGHGVGGVCPFGIKDGVKVYLDESLKRFHEVFPACGSASSAVRLTIPELELASGSPVWVDVCKAWQEEGKQGTEPSGMAGMTKTA
ncbi:YbaK/EbsC family protein [Enterocloster sp. OA13]|uniref:YbaK/EbsC family protein n=1 Tax=Enterocloster TaxID=2719313 RepID=UPI00046ECC67|nr:YbaK/EbsC family protein [Lachnoclostridium pacaense]MCC2818016.1 YbaK/EbsC family protein [Lachnoclostridium pacaense]MCH1949163.1 YbaK/EbsC family protein [Enterocloster sp. OA13]RJW36245.1 YbaK/EbsC family protein [Clostridiales bacterium TF09-2AC]